MSSPPGQLQRRSSLDSRRSFRDKAGMTYKLLIVTFTLFIEENMSKIKIIALLTIFLDILGFTIMIPAMPGLANDYHVAYTMITL